jgi:outer membrane protein assembly factor BamB
MRLQIVVAPTSKAPPPEADSPMALASAATKGPFAAPGRHAGRAGPGPAREVIDIFVDGANITARIRETHGAFVLRDLGFAVVDLAHRPRGKATVRFYDEPWELCIQRFGAAACLSVYRTGPDPVVAVYDRAVRWDDVVLAAREAIEQLLVAANALSPARAELMAARSELAAAAGALAGVPAVPGDAADAVESTDSRVPELVPVAVEPNRDAPISFGAEFALREAEPVALRTPMALRRIANRDATDDGDAVERSDLHALLFRGRVWVEVRGRTVDLGEAHPVLLAERILDLAFRGFDAWERGLPFNARGEAAGAVIGVRLAAEGELALTLGPATPHGLRARGAVQTFPALGVDDVLNAALAFGRALVRAILRRDPTQSGNLRLAALRRSLREAADALRQASQTDSKINPSPEPYRAFAASARSTEGDAADPASPSPLRGTRLRYAERWRAIVPGIDLRATYLCGDRLIACASTEMWALDRATGRVLWRSDVARGTSVVTPAGIARLAADGTLAVYDFESGQRVLRTRIAMRAGGPVAGAVVSLPGLPKLIVVTEGEHHLVAIDLGTGEPVWRWSWASGRGATRGVPRLKRAGKLVYFTCGDGALTALDVMSGAVVWRLRDRLRFRSPPALAHDALFAVSGGMHGIARLYCVDPFAGHVRWQTDLAEQTSPCTVDGAPIVATSAVAVALRQKTGLALATYRREDGSRVAPRGDTGIGAGPAAGPAAPIGTSWLAVDDMFIGNAPTGDLVAVAARSGELQWRCVLGPNPLEADIPRRLEPVLRNGALFVPCSLVTPSSKSAPEARRGRSSEDGAAAGVCILRPADGALLGTIAPTEAIPDLLRVDEQCNVIVAEESGHVASFAALPRLSLVGPADAPGRRSP